MSNLSKIQSFNKRLEELRSERSYFMDYWGELSDYHLAHRGRFLNKSNKRAPKRNTKQYNSTSRLALRTLASGMMAGITSPARPWFKLQVPDPQMNEYAAVKEWLHDCEVIMYRVFAQSNTYNSLHSLYAELGCFGTGAMGVYENFDDVIRCKTYTAGSYMLGLGADDKIDTFYREYKSTVGRLVKQFGETNVSDQVRNLWKQGSIEAEIDVVHAVEPNDDRDTMSPLAWDMPWRSVYYEQAHKSGDDRFLRRSGFMEFPILTPRWDVSAEEIYSEDCPGMIALGDTKALQLGEKRKYQALDKLTNPPLQGDSSIRSQVNGGPPASGEIIWLTQNSAGLQSVYGNFQPRLDLVQAIQQEVELRIKRTFYEDLFLMLANSDRRQITAREVAEKHEEKLLMLGPVLERLHSELLDPLIDRVFNVLQRAGVLPPPPQELIGTEMTVEYISVLAQAQRMVGISSIERTANFAMTIAQMWPESRHKFDASQAIDEYANNVGVNPRVVRADDDANQLVAAEQQAQAQAAAMAQSQQAVQTAKDASEVDAENLSNMLRNAGLQ